MASQLYELLKARDAAESADTHCEILRHLQNTQVPESERAGLDALKRLHLEQFCTSLGSLPDNDELLHSDYVYCIWNGCMLPVCVHLCIAVRLRQREKNVNKERVSERRSQWRAECRARWQQDASAKSVSLEAVEQRYPGLFQDKVRSKSVCM